MVSRLPRDIPVFSIPFNGFDPPKLNLISTSASTLDTANPRSLPPSAPLTRHIIASPSPLFRRFTPLYLFIITHSHNGKSSQRDFTRLLIRVQQFYSHEVLTSRKYGVATVWLVATLGSKSTLKKVSKAAILKVDVAKACDTIVAPEAPMALRLQSNLL